MSAGGYGKISRVFVTGKQDDLTLLGCLLKNLDDFGSSLIINMHQWVVAQNRQCNATFCLVGFNERES